MYRKEFVYDRETRDYAMYLDGELVGFARTYHEAEITLDQLVFELMADGQFATATELDGGQPDAYTLAADAGAFGPQAPAWDINNSEYCPKHETWFGRMPCPECYTEARQPSADDDVPTDIPDEYPNPTPGGPPPPEFAQTLQSQAIESRIATCANCQGIHRTQECSEIRAHLFAPAPWSDPALGRELCRMKWRDFKGFVALLREVHAHGHLVVYAASYQAFIRSNRPDSDLTITQVLTAWAREMSGEPMPRMRAA